MSDEALIQKQGSNILAKIVLIFIIVYQISLAQIPVKIMPLGDSITSGVNPVDTSAKEGYRRYLYQLLVNSGFSVDFVGSLFSETTDDFDSDNEGHPGMYAFRASNPSLSMRHNLRDYLSKNHPDVILLHIGTNDINSVLEPKSTDSLTNDVVKLLDTISNFDPNITIILARIINRADNKSLQDSISRFNAKLQLKADSLANDGRKIVVVDMESVLSYPDDFSPDMVHPNDTGYGKMADLWFAKICEVLTIKLINPKNYSIVTSKDITLNWEPVIGANYYWVQISMFPKKDPSHYLFFPLLSKNIHGYHVET